MTGFVRRQGASAGSAADARRRLVERRRAELERLQALQDRAADRPFTPAEAAEFAAALAALTAANKALESRPFRAGMEHR
jgi:hypothetical protein